VQAPVIEVLESIAPAKTDEPAPSRPAAPRVRHAERSDVPRHDAPRHHPAAHHRTPPAPRVGAVAPPVTASDVCALGRQYGGWRPDSAQARICHQTYGH
jgi:hypothetical protein